MNGGDGHGVKVRVNMTVHLGTKERRRNESQGETVALPAKPGTDRARTDESPRDRGEERLGMGAEGSSEEVLGLESTWAGGCGLRKMGRGVCSRRSFSIEILEYKYTLFDFSRRSLKICF